MNPYEDETPTSIQGNGQPPRASTQDQKSAIAAALVGTAALGGAAVVMSRFLDDGSNVAEVQGESLNSEQTPEADPNIAGDPIMVNPDITSGNPNGAILPSSPHEQTFDEAFAEARAAQGPGHYFEWHGQTFNTYHNQEWGSMSHSEQQEFLATVPGYETHGGGGVPSGLGSAVAQSTSPRANDEVPPAVEGIDPDSTIDTPVMVTNDTAADNDVIVEGASLDVPSAQSDENTKADYVMAEIDGDDVVIIDIDDDDRPDAILNPDNNIIVMDTDGDHILDTRAVVDIDNSRLTQIRYVDETVTIDGSMDSLHEQHPGDEPQLADDMDMAPDFDNNAPIDDYDV